jgi:Transglycosylase
MKLFRRTLKWSASALILLIALLLGSLAVWLGTAWHQAGRVLASHDLSATLTGGHDARPLADREWLVLSAIVGERIDDASGLCVRDEEQTCPRRALAVAIADRIYDRRSGSGILYPALIAHFLVRKIERESKPEALARVYLDGTFFGLDPVGIEPASQAVFGKSAAALSEDEALSLGVMAIHGRAQGDHAWRAERVSTIRQQLQANVQ